MHRPTRHRILLRWRRRLLWVCIILGALPGAASAEIYVRIAGIPGDLTAGGYDDGKWFSVDSGSYGTERMLQDPGVKGGTSDLKIGIGEFLPIGLSGSLGKPAAKLVQAAISSVALADAEIHLVESTATPDELFVFGKILLKNVFVADCSMDSGGEERPRFGFRLLYNEIEIENIIRDPDDPKATIRYTTSWNLAANTGGYRIDDGTQTNNFPPTISALPDQSVDEDGTLELEITVGDPDGAAADLTVTGKSQDTSVVLDSGIVISGDGALRTVVITPRPDRNGLVPLSLVVTDGSDSVSTSFNLAVSPTPDPPAIAELGALVTSITDPASTIPIDASDPDQSAETLLLTAKSADPATLPESALALAYAAGWQLKIDPSGTQVGTTEVKIEAVDDTGQRTSRSFMLTINGPGKSAPTSITISNDSVKENALGPVVIGALGAVDPDGDSSFTFGMIDSAGGQFQLAGNALSSAPGVTFDYEESAEHTLRLSVTDGSGLTFVQDLTIKVTNLNEAPSVALDFPAPPDFVGTEFTVSPSQVELADPDAGANPVEVDFSLTGGALTIDDSGALFGKVSGNGSSHVVVEAVLADVNLVIGSGGLAYAAGPSVVSDTMTVTIDDLGSTGEGGPRTTTSSAQFNVQPEPLQRFLDEYFTPAQQADPELGGLLGDADWDEMNTLLEFKLGTNPLDGKDGRQNVELSEVEIAGEYYTRISYIQRTDASTPHTRMSVRVASAVSGWAPGEGSLMLESRVAIGEDRERVTLRSIAPRRDSEREFYQLSVDYSGSVN